VKSDLALSGLLGLVIAGFIFVAASGISANLPGLIQDAMIEAMVFAFLLFIAVVEMPLMVIGMRQLVHSASTPRAIVLGTNAGYVAFASVYAAAFLLITRESAWALLLAALTLLRFASGVFVR
jgi:hypothetical protein